MKTFLVIREQENAGCDYTIGCGTTVGIIEAESLEEAEKQLMDFDEAELEKEIKELIEEHGDEWENYLSDYINDNIELNDNDEWRLASLWLVELGSNSEMVDEFDNNKAKLESILKRHRKSYQETAERKELNRLQKKYK